MSKREAEKKDNRKNAQNKPKIKPAAITTQRKMTIRILIMWYFTAPERCIEICQHQHDQYTHRNASI